MKNVLNVLVAAMAVVFLASCEKVVGEGPVVTQVRTIEDFKRIAVSIPGEVRYKIAPNYKVELHAQQNILDILQTNKVGDELVIKFKDGKNVKSNQEIFILVEAPVVIGANLSGSAELDMVGNFISTTLDLRVSGSGNIEVEKATTADKLTATISGSGNIMVLDGTAKNEDLRVSGSGNIHLEDVAAEKASAEISGSGNIQVKLSQNLDARISGSGSIFYLGAPVVSAQVSGSGRVKPL